MDDDNKPIGYVSESMLRALKDRDNTNPALVALQASGLPLYAEPLTDFVFEDYWMFYDDQRGEWSVSREHPAVIRTGAELIHTRRVADDINIDSILDDIIAHVEDIMVDADVDYPAGAGCGHSISFDTAELRLLIEKSLLRK